MPGCERLLRCGRWRRERLGLRVHREETREGEPIERDGDPERPQVLEPQDHALERRARPRGEARETKRPVLVHDVAVARSRAHAGQRRVPDHGPQQAQGRQPRGLHRPGGSLGHRRDHPDDKVALHPHRRDDDQGQRRPAGQGHEQLAGEIGLERAEEEAGAHRLHRDLLFREGGDDLLDLGAELHLGHALESEAEDDRLATGLHGARDPR